MTRDWWQTDPTYVIDDPPKVFECPPIFDFCWTNDASPWTNKGNQGLKVMVDGICYGKC